MHARELMTRQPAVIAADDSIAQAAEMMWSRSVGMLPVIENYTSRRLVGVLTDRDIVTRHLAQGHGPHATVRDYMTRDALVTVHPDTPLLEVAELMATHRVRRLPVATHDGVVTGVIAQADLAPAVGAVNPTLVERATAVAAPTVAIRS